MNTLIALFIAASTQYNLPKNLLSSLCYVESKYDIDAFHKDDGKGNSVGVCQIKLPTAKLMGFRGTEKQLMSPEVNILYAAKYLSHQIKRYKGNVTYGIISYNQGSRKLLTNTKYSDTVNKEWRKQNERKSIEERLREAGPKFNPVLRPSSRG